MGEAKAKKTSMEFTPRADTALLRAPADLLPHRQAEGKKLKQWQLVAQRVALEMESGKGGDVSTVGCMNRYKALVSIGRFQPKDKWPGDEELNKLLDEAVAEDAPRASQLTYSESLLKDLQSSAPPATPPFDEAARLKRLPEKRLNVPPQPSPPFLECLLKGPKISSSPASRSRVTIVTPPQPAEEPEPVVNPHKPDPKTGASPSKKRKRRHDHDEDEEKAAARPPSSKTARSPKPLVLRLRRTPLNDKPEGGGDAPQWRFVEPEPKKPSKHHSPGTRKSPTKQTPSEPSENANKPSKPLPSPAVPRNTSETQANLTPELKSSSKERTAPSAKASTARVVVSRPMTSQKDQARPAPVSIMPCSDALADSTARGFFTDASSTLNGPAASPRHVFGDTMLVGELGQAVALERRWLKMAGDTQSQPPNQVEADADQQDRELTTLESSCREIDELKQMVKSMAAALAASQREQTELRKLITTSRVPATPMEYQPDLAQQVQHLTNALNQARVERFTLHQGLIGLQQQATQLKSSEIKLQRDVTSLRINLTTLEGTVLQGFEDITKERCAIEASIKDAEHRQQAAFRKFVVDEQLKRQELVADIEKGRAQQKSNAQAQEESLVWFQEEMKREMDELRDSVERDVTVFDDLLDSVQEEHKAQLNILNAKISGLSKPNEHHTATQATETSDELEELREELDIERHERQREYKALLRSIQRIVAPE